jgi:hypothetical protein
MLSILLKLLGKFDCKTGNGTLTPGRICINMNHAIGSAETEFVSLLLQFITVRPAELSFSGKIIPSVYYYM